MATKPTISSVAVGAKISAALWNAQVYNLGRFVDVTKPVCQVYQTASQSLANATWTPISFDSETVDTDNQHGASPFPTRITIGNTLGWYLLWGNITWTNSSYLGRRVIRATLNGATLPINGSQADFSPYYVTTGPTASNQIANSVMPPTLVQATVATDYVELQGYQDTGGAVATSVTGNWYSQFGALYLGTLQ